MRIDGVATPPEHSVSPQPATGVSLNASAVHSPSLRGLLSHFPTWRAKPRDPPASGEGFLYLRRWLVAGFRTRKIYPKLRSLPPPSGSSLVHSTGRRLTTAHSACGHPPVSTAPDGCAQ